MTCELFIVLPPEQKCHGQLGDTSTIPRQERTKEAHHGNAECCSSAAVKKTLLPPDRFQNSFGIPTPSPVRRKLEPVCSDWFQFLLTTSCCQKQHNPKTEKKAFRPFFRGRVNPPPADSSTLFSFSGGGGGAALE